MYIFIRFIFVIDVSETVCGDISVDMYTQVYLGIRK